MNLSKVYNKVPGSKGSSLENLNFGSFNDEGVVVNPEAKEDITAKEVISRVMSKAEIKRHSLKTNNKDYFLDFIEEKPVREYSKEPRKAKNLDRDFKKKQV